jgi:hypothetical protein
MGFWNDLLVKRTEDWVYAPLGDGQVPPGGERRKVEPNSVYLSIFLQSMRLVNVRTGLSRFYGTVHSYTSLPHRSGQPAQFNVIVTPGNLKGVDAARIDRVIQISQRLLGPVPYRGGDLELEAGLFSIKSVDMADSFLSFLEKTSTLAGVSFIGTALPFVNLLKDGVNLLLGGSDATILEIGLSRKFASVETGYCAVVRAPKSQIDVSQLHVDPNDYRLLGADQKPLADYPYMVLQITASPIRDDWFMIPELATAYHTLQADVREGSYQDAKDSLTVFRRVVMTSDDLLFADAQKLVQTVEAEVTAVMGATPTAMGEGLRSIRNLAEIPLYRS